MEQFIKQKKRDLILCRVLYIISLVIAIGSLALGEMNIIVSVVRTNDHPIFEPYILAAIFAIWQAVRIKKALKDTEKMKARYIAETDERNLLIERSASRMTCIITIVLLAVTGSVFAYINEIVYHTLFNVCIVYLLIFVFCNMFYGKKY